MGHYVNFVATTLSPSGYFHRPKVNYDQPVTEVIALLPLVFL